MSLDPFSQILVLLFCSVLVVAGARRAHLPPLLGYLAVGMVLGPHALGWVGESAQTHTLAEVGVVFLLFTLGLEFSWPRMVAMRREVFGLGLLQVSVTMLAFALLGRLLNLSWSLALALGGAIAMTSTAMVIRQLTEQNEINRTHGRLSVAILLFQDLAFVPLLGLATAVAAGEAQSAFSGARLAQTLLGAMAALLIVLVLGRWLLRPLFYEIAHSRLKELFTLLVLFVALGSAWVTERAGLSLALGGFLAGMMLAETEYRHQVEAVIRPFRELLLGLFFVSVGMLLDVALLASQFGWIMLMVIVIVSLKVVIAASVSRPFTSTHFKAVRTGLVLGAGGEFGIAILTLLMQGQSVPVAFVQPVLLALVMTLLLAPFGIRFNKTIARWLLREARPQVNEREGVTAALRELGEHEHVLLCGFGRVGQQVARVLQSQGFKYIAADLDLARVRPARLAGEPVVFGDSSDEDVLVACGIGKASAVVVTFANPTVSIGIVRAVRALRPDVPILVRTEDDQGLVELKQAGATEVVPETFEASLMLASQVLMFLKVPVSRVVRTVGQIRRDRYSSLRGVVRSESVLAQDDLPENSDVVVTVVLPPSAWAVGRSLGQLHERGTPVQFIAVRRQGQQLREPTSSFLLEEGDALVIQGTIENVEHAEAILLAG